MDIARTRRFTLGTLVALVAPVAVVLVACGSGTDAATDGTGTTTTDGGTSDARADGSVEASTSLDPLCRDTVSGSYTKPPPCEFTTATFDGTTVYACKCKGGCSCGFACGSLQASPSVVLANVCRKAPVTDASTDGATSDAASLDAATTDGAMTDGATTDAPTATCTDGIRNGGESDVDCGSVCPTPCAATKACRVPADCASGACIGFVCPLQAIESVGVGANHACAVSANGVVKCWGNNGQGQLGLGVNDPSRSTPTDAVNLTMPAAGLAVGMDHACARRNDGSVVCWGANTKGQLGDGTFALAAFAPGAPLDLGAGRVAVDIASGHEHTCAILDDDTVRCWGRNDLKQSDPTSSEDRLSLPGAPIALGGPARAVVTGEMHSCALLAGGTVKCWGANVHGNLGIGSMDIDSKPPTTVSFGAHTVKALSAGQVSTCAVLDDDTLSCWGGNFGGELGTGDYATVRAPRSVSFPGGRIVRTMAVVGVTTCVVFDDLSLRCWGHNSLGTLGLGDTTARLVPDPVAVSLGAGRTPAKLGGGNFTACAILHDGALTCWGSNSFGKLGVGDETNRLAPPAAPIPF